MFDNWNRLFITEIGLATYVPPNTGTATHNNRPFHGLVLNGKCQKADYVFSDGFVLKTTEYSLFYLPKNSSYKIVTRAQGEGCWAINFDLSDNITAQPFSAKFQNPEYVLQTFKNSVSVFCKADENINLIITKNLYDILLQFKKEIQKLYVPSNKMLLLKPALDRMNANYFKTDCTVEALSEACGISVAYFRRIFTKKFGIGPKEYLIGRRINYAKKLLASNQFTISEVAEICGYSEPCHFSREFARRTGISPRNFQSLEKTNIELSTFEEK